MKANKIVVIFIIFFSFQAFAQKTQEAFENIKKYGIKGEGKSDDAPAIQKAIDYCENNSVKSLVLPDGKYLLRQPLIFRKGGVQILGTGALLREESWAKHMDKRFSNDEPYLGCTLIVPKNSIGILFDKTVTDPVRITNVGFVAQQERKPGTTTAIKFSSEFWGPTWPFIIERCHFRGFNFAVKFESQNQYNVAFVEFHQNAFSQNDECVYFSDIPDAKVSSTGARNLSWGFTFENNKCHDNSRIIRGAFAKEQVSILNNNMEGNIPYADGRMPKNIVDIELSHATVNFEGNHFESVVSDCVSISSAFLKKDGTFYDYSGKTTNDEKNKIIIKGNNFDGIAKEYKPFLLKGLLVYNYDPYKLFLDECDIRQNDSNTLNQYFSDFALQNGTTIKTPTGKYDNTYQTLSYFSSVKTVSVQESRNRANIISPFSGFGFLRITKSTDLYSNPTEKIALSKADKFVGASFIVNNPNQSGFLGQIIFDVSKDGGKTYQRKVVLGTYGTNVGFTTITGIIPVFGLGNIVKAYLVTNIIGDTEIFVADKYTLFAISDANNIYAVPAFKN